MDRTVLEAFAADGFRRGIFTRGEITRLLGFETPLQTDEFLKRAGLNFPYTEEDLRDDFEFARSI